MVVSEYHSILVSIPAAIIIGREIAVSALREWMSGLGKGIKMAVIYVAKAKTAMQLLALTLLILYTPENSSGNSSGQTGRAQPCQGWGREFESRFPLQSCGWVAEWLCSGLQSRGRRFDSGLSLKL
jgi:phosphatidylglycerophosphate synthase